MILQASVGNFPLLDDSIDLIFTDPPYHKKFLYLYGCLAREAARVLKLGGFVLAMCGGMYLDENMRLMSEHLTWFWNYEVFMGNVSTVIWPKRTIARNKPIIAYSKGKGMPRCNVLSGISGGGNDKTYHHWGQDVESARYYIDCFSKPGDLVYDPLIGGGTTAIACELIGRRCISSDVDPAALATTRKRLEDSDILHTLPLFASE